MEPFHVFVIQNKSPSTLVVKKNSSTLFFCEAPRMFFVEYEALPDFSSACERKDNNRIFIFECIYPCLNGKSKILCFFVPATSGET